MGATSVTGVGNGSGHNSPSVEKLIGPRWTQEKEDEFNRMKKQINWMIIGFGSLATFSAAVALLLLIFSR